MYTTFYNIYKFCILTLSAFMCVKMQNMMKGPGFIMDTACVLCDVQTEFYK